MLDYLSELMEDANDFSLQSAKACAIMVVVITGEQIGLDLWENICSGG